MMKSLGMVLIGGAAIAFLVPHFLRCWAGTRAVKSPSNVQEGGSDSDAVCLVRSRRNDAFFCDLEALVPSHPIGCIVEKTGAVLHCIKCT